MYILFIFPRTKALAAVLPSHTQLTPLMSTHVSNFCLSFFRIPSAVLALIVRWLGEYLLHDGKCTNLYSCDTTVRRQWAEVTKKLFIIISVYKSEFFRLLFFIIFLCSIKQCFPRVFRSEVSWLRGWVLDTPSPSKERPASTHTGNFLKKESNIYSEIRLVLYGHVKPVKTMSCFTTFSFLLQFFQVKKRQLNN